MLERKVAGDIGKDIENIRSPFHVDLVNFGSVSLETMPYLSP